MNPESTASGPTSWVCAWPPSRASASNRVTSWRCCSRYAAVSPDTPAPTTATRSRTSPLPPGPLRILQGDLQSVGVPGRHGFRDGLGERFEPEGPEREVCDEVVPGPGPAQHGVAVAVDVEPRHAVGHRSHALGESQRAP